MRRLVYTEKKERANVRYQREEELEEQRIREKGETRNYLTTTEKKYNYVFNIIMLQTSLRARREDW